MNISDGTFVRHYCRRNGQKFLSPKWLVTKCPCPKTQADLLEKKLFAMEKVIGIAEKLDAYDVEKLLQSAKVVGTSTCFNHPALL